MQQLRTAWLVSAWLVTMAVCVACGKSPVVPVVMDTPTGGAADTRGGPAGMVSGPPLAGMLGAGAGASLQGAAGISAAGSSALTQAGAGAGPQPSAAGVAAAGASGANASDEADAGEPDGEDAGVAACSDCCADGYPRGMVSSTTRAIQHFTPSPADVAVCPDGAAYITLDGQDEIWRVPSSGPAALYAAVSGVQPAGIACDERGRLFVAAFSLRTGSAVRAPAILLIEKAGAKPRALPQPSAAWPLSTPNGVAFAPGLGVYVTDTLGGVIARSHEDATGTWHTSVVASNVLGVNGIAYDPGAHKLYVSNSLSSEVSAYAVGKDGALSQRTVLWTARSGALDGLAVDEHGQVYVANYGEGPVLRIPEAREVARVAQPASLAFRGGTLFVVDYHLAEPTVEGGLYAVELGVCGAELFVSRPPS
ncbi:MAG: hypothetical protein RL701_7542 [Pseudomonadota bacterium]